MIFLCLVANASNAIDRPNLAVAAPSVRDELGIDAATMGVLRAFSGSSGRYFGFGSTVIQRSIHPSRPSSLPDCKRIEVRAKAQRPQKSHGLRCFATGLCGA